MNTVYLGEDGLVPLEVRFHHDPASSHGFVGAALSSNIIHWYEKDQAVDRRRRSSTSKTSAIRNGRSRCRA